MNVYVNEDNTASMEFAFWLLAEEYRINQYLTNISVDDRHEIFRNLMNFLYGKGM